MLAKGRAKQLLYNLPYCISVPLHIPSAWWAGRAKPTHGKRLAFRKAKAKSRSVIVPYEVVPQPIRKNVEIRITMEIIIKAEIFLDMMLLLLKYDFILFFSGLIALVPGI